MPEGLPKGLSPQQQKDLFTFLLTQPNKYSSHKPISKHATSFEPRASAPIQPEARAKIAVHWLLLLLLASLTPSITCRARPGQSQNQSVLVTGVHDFDKTFLLKVFPPKIHEIAVTFASHDATNNPVFRAR